MTALLKTPATLVWAGLIAATALSLWLGVDHGIGSRQAATTLVLLVAFIKVRFVGAYFMELRHAPLWLRGAFDAWVLIVGTVNLAIYLIA